MDTILICKIFFTIGTAVDLGGTLIPSFRQKIMNYGPRKIALSKSREEQASQSYITTVFDFLASMQVPHTWFIHYYLASVLSSIFWGLQIFTRGKAFEFMTAYTTPPVPGMTANQVFLAWACMAFQGTRRLYECVTLTKPSQSKMWAGLWVIGILYYVFMGISVWIEGITALNQLESAASLLEISRPSLKTSIAVPLFVLASFTQYYCHKYLASLVKYTLPERQMFRWVVCPHYTSECLIYTALAILAAPKGHLFNGTALAGLGFVVTNLAVSADSTRKWYEQKFGEKKLQGRWRMVPYVF